MRHRAAAYALPAVATGRAAATAMSVRYLSALAVCGSAPGPNHPADLRFLHAVLLPAELAPVQKACRIGRRRAKRHQTIQSPCPSDQQEAVTLPAAGLE